MKIEIQGFGSFEINEDKYAEFVEFLKLDMDVFLHMLSMSRFCTQILCLNFEEINLDCSIPFGYIKTKIGIGRINYLVKKRIIKKIVYN